MGHGSQKNGRMGNSYLLLWLLLLCAAAKVAVVVAAVAALGCVCGLRYVGSRVGWHSILIEKQ